MNRFFYWRTALAATCLLAGAATEAVAKQDVNRPPATPHNNGRVTASLCLVSSSRAELDINNVRAMVLNGGDMWWDLGNPRYEVPKVTEINRPRRHSIFAGALWVGGMDGGQLYVAAQTYRQGSTPDAGFWPGPLDDNGVVDPDICAAWNSHAKINRADIDNFRGTAIPGDPNQLAQSIREWPGRNNPYLSRPRLNQTLAPFIDVNDDGDYDPLDGDYPDIRGDQAIWWVMNDVGNTKIPTTPEIGLEVNVMAFAFQTADQLNNMTFYQQKIINKSQKTLNQTWIGQWVDPDLGYFNDDFVGCDVSRGLGFCYNGDNLDEGVTGYGTNPPTVAVDFFEGPRADDNDGIDNDRDSYLTGTLDSANIDEPGEKIIMSNFVYYNNDFSINGNPTQAQHFYNYLRSKITTGQDLQFGGDGLNGTIPGNLPYAFMFPSGGCGNSDPYGFGFHNPPVAGQTPPYAWSESNIDGNGRSNIPADRRFLQSAGPFTLRPGAVNRVTVGVIWQRAGSGGPQGSNGAVCNADDKAQAAFDADFKIPAGPPPPTVQATVLDRQIVLSILPGSIVGPNGAITTETYAEIDSTLPAAAIDRIRRFEGYLVYETKVANLSDEELSNPDQARLIARGDIVNGVTQIVNYEFQQDVNALVPVQKVSGDNADLGIFHTLNISTTAFAEKSAQLVNFKRYYFKVVPFAYNADQTLFPSGAKVVNEPFKAGRGSNITVIPSNPVVLNGGTILNSKVNDEVPIKRIMGQGAGGHVLEISEQDEADILANNQKLDLSYDQGKGPISVRIYDPLLVRDANFVVKLSSRLSFRASTLTGRRPQENDVLLSTGQYVRGQTGRAAVPADTVLNTPAIARQTARIDRGPSVQIPGRAIVRRVVSVEPVTINNVTDNIVTLELEMLNDHLGGTFTADIERYQFGAGGDSTLLGYEAETRSFEIVGVSSQGTAQEFTRHDFWKWRVETDTDWNYVVRRISEINEELIPEYGLSIQVRPGRTPGYQPRLNTQTSFLEASLTHSGLPWLAGVPSEPGATAETFIGVNWLLPSSLPVPGATTRRWDPNGTYSNILPVVPLRGTWAAYVNARQGPTGAQYGTDPDRRLYNLHSIDVVFTSDKSKWTRVPVIQIVANNPKSNVPNNPVHAFTKSSSIKPSVNKDGQPDNSTAPSGQPSTGMGWFPGYAIDLDRGIRVNMMFAESTAPAAQGGQGPNKGADLIWEPGTTEDGPGKPKYAGRNFVYVLETKYDEGREMERQQDEIAPLPIPQTRSRYKTLYDDIMYVNYPRLITGRTLLANDARVRIRVDREFTSYPEPADALAGPNTNPEYSFSLQGQAVATGQTKTACDALSIIRVVPNPYYAFSQYEQRQLDNIVKVTNLPKRCDITIYTLNGTLVRRLRKDDTSTFLDYNLKNDTGLPIGSGVYLFHINAPDLKCETIVKWFGVMRPIDLDTF